ncbi:MAG: hypothetical protein ACYTFT_13640, partial [Planctomycetota bacterium]
MFEAGRVLSADEETNLAQAWQTFYESAAALDGVRVMYEDWYRFDPSRAERSFHLRSFLLTYAAELALVETAGRLARLASGNENAERFMNAPRPEVGLPEAGLSRVRQELLGVRDQARVEGGRQYLVWLERGLRCRDEARRYGVDDLWRRCERHLEAIQALSIVERSSIAAAADAQPLKRGVRRAWYPVQMGVAEWMGDLKLRRVGHYLVTHEQQETMDAALEPGD